MHKMTEDNLKAAFAGESQAHMKYKIFAERAEKEGKPNVAKLFNAISFAEKIHAFTHLRELKGIGKTGENFDTAIAGETYGIEEMYPAFKAVAELQDEKSAIRSIDYAVAAEKDHAQFYKRAKESVYNEKDLNIGDIWVCSVCGHTVEGEPPDICPVCKVKKEMYVKF